MPAPMFLSIAREILEGLIMGWKYGDPGSGTGRDARRPTAGTRAVGEQGRDRRGRFTARRRESLPMSGSGRCEWEQEPISLHECNEEKGTVPFVTTTTHMLGVQVGSSVLQVCRNAAAVIESCGGTVGTNPAGPAEPSTEVPW